MFTAKSINTTDTATYTFTDLPLGDPHPDREMIFIAGTRALHTIALGASIINSLTVAGDAATFVDGEFDVQVDASASRLAVYRLAVPDGDTATVAVNLNRSALRCGIAAFRVIRRANFGLVDFQKSKVDGGTLSTDLGNGFAIAASMFFATGGTIGTSWSNVTEYSDDTMEGSTQLSFASDDSTSPATGVSITPTFSGTGRSNPLAIVAAFENYDDASQRRGITHPLTWPLTYSLTWPLAQ